MTQAEALRILKTGANVFLTGEPGAGKTYTINQYISYLRSHKIDVAVTASTGIAATHIGGMTIHSWSGIGIKEYLDKYTLDKITSSEYINKRITKTKVLIIDEISMLQAGTLSMVDAVCREIKQSTEAFGGMQVVLVGDFFQLPPIKKKLKIEKQSRLIPESQGHFAYESDAWSKSSPIVCYITEQHRQEDDTFLDLLISIRQSSVVDEHYEYLKTRYIERSDMPEDTTKLYSHNLDVDKVNEQELGKLDEEEKEFMMSAAGSAALVKSLKKGCLSPEVLVLKKGSVVMFTKNNPKEKYVNGTMGTVVDFDPFSGYPVVETKQGKVVTVLPMDWVVEDGGKTKAQISQIPLRLAWAITVHKSQGMSMDSAIMDLSSVFEYGQGYVALSRVRQMDGLYLLGCNAKALQVHPGVAAQDKYFQQQSQQASRAFEEMSEEDISKMHKNFILAVGGKLEKVKDGQSDSIGK